MYSTTKSPTVFTGDKPAQLLKVSIETKNVMTNIKALAIRRSQTDLCVPSSYSWNPTNPLINKQAVKAEVKPFWTAVNHGYAPFPGGITPESKMSDMKVNSMYR